MSPQFLVLLALLAVANAQTVLSPPKEKMHLPSVGAIFVPGAYIQPSQYVPFAKTLQETAPFAIWIAFPSFPLDMAVPINLWTDRHVKPARTALLLTGMPSDAPLFMLGHSVGGSSAQQYLASNPGFAVGQVLFGAVLRRAYRSAEYETPTLSVNGELDGQTLIGRVAEAYWHQVMHPAPGLWGRFPVVVVPGANHFLPAVGPVGSFVRARDLRPEVSAVDAHAYMCAAIAAFMQEVVDKQPSAALVRMVHASKQYVAALIAGLELEGNYQLTPPCNSDRPDPTCPYYAAWPLQKKGRAPMDPPYGACVCGSPWVQKVASPMMAGLDLKTAADKGARYFLETVDAFHDVTDTKPHHLPKLWTDCSNATAPGCAINTTTVTQNVHDCLDNLDLGIFPVSASEIRVKLVSRQSVLAATTTPTNPPADGMRECADINQRAIDWALGVSRTAAKERYSRFGVRLVVGDDVSPKVQAGPAWINGALQYNREKTAKGEAVMRVVSTRFFSTLDGWESKITKYAAGVHYCKLLSPARAVEWIHSIGLRERYAVPDFIAHPDIDIDGPSKPPKNALRGAEVLVQ